MKNQFDEEPFETDSEFDDTLELVEEFEEEPLVAFSALDEKEGLFEEFEDEQLNTLLEFDEEPELLQPEVDETLEGEVSRRSRVYIQWVQRSLNQILGTSLAVDGIKGRQTRSAIRSFQRQKGLRADGIVDPRTERVLIAAGASPPPSSPAVSPGPAKAALAAPAQTKPISLKEIVGRAFGLLKEQQGASYPYLSREQVRRLGCLLLRLLWRTGDDRFITAQGVLDFRNLTYKKSPSYSRAKQWLTYGSRRISDRELLRRLQRIDEAIIDGRHKINQLFAQMGSTVHARVRALRNWVANRQKDHLSIYRCYRGY